MKISNNQAVNAYISVNKSKSQPASNKKTAQNSNFDKVMISSSAPQTVSDEKLAAQLSHSISQEIRSGASSAKLDEIRNQIDTGTYNLALGDVARKIVLG